MSESLHDEVVRVARDLIRLDTTNAREPGLGNETLCAEYRDYLTGTASGRVARPAGAAGGTDQGRGDGADGGRWPVGTPTSCRATARLDAPALTPCRRRRLAVGPGAVDMKNEVAARAVAMPSSPARARHGDLWFLAVADERTVADVGMRWLPRRTDIGPPTASTRAVGRLR
jgi:hypothetical protein